MTVLVGLTISSPTGGIEGGDCVLKGGIALSQHLILTNVHSWWPQRAGFLREIEKFNRNVINIKKSWKQAGAELCQSQLS